MSDARGITKRHSIQTIKAVGERFIDVVCDDAYAGSPTCRVAALMLLGSLVKLAKADGSSYILDSLIRLNFITILVESIGTISHDLRGTGEEGSCLFNLSSTQNTDVV
jgi:nuclear pore complex protein Nup205